MPSENKPKQKSIRHHAGILLRPKNLLKTIAGQIPIASIATELIDQIEGHDTDLRIGDLEAEVKSLAKLKAMCLPIPRADRSTLRRSKAMW